MTNGEGRAALQALIGRLRVHRDELLTIGANASLLRQDLKDAADELAALIAESSRLLDQWLPIETAPKGYDKDAGFHRVLFFGWSTGNSFEGGAVVSGWMDSERVPIHNYRYKLRITHWRALPAPPTSEKQRTETKL